MKPFSEAEIALVRLVVLYGRVRHLTSKHPNYSVFQDEHEAQYKRILAHYFAGDGETYQRWIWSGDVDSIVQYAMRLSAVPGKGLRPLKVRITNGA